MEPTLAPFIKTMAVDAAALYSQGSRVKGLMPICGGTCPSEPCESINASQLPASILAAWDAAFIRPRNSMGHRLRNYPRTLFDSSKTRGDQEVRAAVRSFLSPNGAE